MMRREGGTLDWLHFMSQLTKEGFDRFVKSAAKIKKDLGGKKPNMITTINSYPKACRPALRAWKIFLDNWPA